MTAVPILNAPSKMTVGDGDSDKDYVDGSGGDDEDLEDQEDKEEDQ